MKNVIIMVSSLLLFICSTFMPLTAATEVPYRKETDLFGHTWLETEDSLYFTLHLMKGLQFADLEETRCKEEDAPNLIKMVITPNLAVKPEPGYHFSNPEGSRLLEMQFTALFGASPQYHDNMLYMIDVITVIQKKVRIINPIKTNKNPRNYRELNIPLINWNEPALIHLNEELNELVVCFKKIGNT